MSREIKRVPLDFDWPLRAKWKGYINPFWRAHARPCAACGEIGWSPEASHLYRQWYGRAPFQPSDTGSVPFAADHPTVRAMAERNMRGPAGLAVSSLTILLEAMRLSDLFNRSWAHHLDADDVQALLDADRLWDFTRRPLTPGQEEEVRAKIAGGGNSWLPQSNGYVPPPAEVNAWSLLGIGHDAINCGVCISAKCKRLGIEERCAACEGEGNVWDSPEGRQLYEDWEREEPPTGEGWQLWETVSEGSPISPVFATEEAFSCWLIEEGYSETAVRSFLQRGYAPALVMANGNLYRNIEACVLGTEKSDDV